MPAHIHNDAVCDKNEKTPSYTREILHNAHDIPFSIFSIVLDQVKGQEECKILDMHILDNQYLDLGLPASRKAAL